jgi:hypothetical protein
MKIGNLRDLGSLNNVWQKISSQLVTEGTDSYQKLCSHFNGVDAATAYTDPIAGAYTFFGNAQLDTAQKKFGTASLLLDGTSDYVTIPNSSSWDFGSGDFTIDFWIRWNVVPSGTTPSVFLNRYGGWACWYSPDVKCMTFQYAPGNYLLYTQNCWTDPVANTWYHIAGVRSGNSFKWYKNGVLLSSHNMTGITIPNGSSFGIGGRYERTSAWWWLNGWMDEVKVSKGIARWTSDFTLPTKELGESSITISGLNGNLLQNSDFETWSAGASSAPNGWILSGAGASIARESTTIKLGTYSTKLTRGGSNCVLSQTFHEFKGISYWQGKTVTFGCWVYATVANRVRLYLNDGVGETSSAFHSGDSTWQYLSVSRTLASNSTQAQSYVSLEGGDTSAYCDGAICVEGSAAPQTNSFNISNYCLNGDYDIEYMIRCKTIGGAASNYSIYVSLNNDTGTNYGYQGLSAISTSAAAERGTASLLVTLGQLGAIGEVAIGNMSIFAKSGTLRTSISELATKISGTTVTGALVYGAVWNNSVDIITSLTIFSSVANGLGVGTQIELYRRIA